MDKDNFLNPAEVAKSRPHATKDVHLWDQKSQTGLINSDLPKTKTGE